MTTVLGHTFKEFTRNDWDAFGGADKGSLICYTETEALILSPDQNTITAIDEDGNETVWELIDFRWKPQL